MLLGDPLLTPVPGDVAGVPDEPELAFCHPVEVGGCEDVPDPEGVPVATPALGAPAPVGSDVLDPAPGLADAGQV